MIKRYELTSIDLEGIETLNIQEILKALKSKGAPIEEVNLRSGIFYALDGNYIWSCYRFLCDKRGWVFNYQAIRKE